MLFAHLLNYCWVGDFMDFKRLGKRLREERLKRSYSQEELAEKAGLSSVFISHIECGSAKASLETLVKVCNALGVTPDLILYDSFHESRTYFSDEISSLLDKCSDEEIKIITRLIKAYIEDRY
jgi:transcriptional regulator with XRE-family HTH domain